MLVLYIFIILLFICVSGLTGYIIFVKGLNEEKYTTMCDKKIVRISSQKNFKNINQNHLYNFAKEELKINSIVFGKKFIYLVADYFLLGNVEGEINDNSWIYYNRRNKTKEYIANLKSVGSKNIQEIATILGIDSNFLVSIALIPNECDFKVNSKFDSQIFVTNYSKFNHIINEFESKNVGQLNKDQIIEKFNLVLKKNEERKI